MDVSNEREHRIVFECVQIYFVSKNIIKSINMKHKGNKVPLTLFADFALGLFLLDIINK